MKVDLTPLLSNDVEFSKIVEALAEKFKCDWDDAVHDSYGLFVQEFEDDAQQIHAISCKTETLVKEEEALEIDDVIAEAEELCRKADGI